MGADMINLKELLFIVATLASAPKDWTKDNKSSRMFLGSVPLYFASNFSGAHAQASAQEAKYVQRFY